VSIVRERVRLGWASTRSLMIRVRLAVGRPGVPETRSPVFTVEAFHFAAIPEAWQPSSIFLSPMSGVRPFVVVLVHALYRRLHLNGFLIPVEGVATSRPEWVMKTGRNRTRIDHSRNAGALSRYSNAALRQRIVFQTSDSYCCLNRSKTWTCPFFDRMAFAAN